MGRVRGSDPAMEAGQVDVVIVRDIDWLTRNLTDSNALKRLRPPRRTADR
jgi:hypothetical protein